MGDIILECVTLQAKRDAAIARAEQAERRLALLEKVIMRAEDEGGEAAIARAEAAEADISHAVAEAKKYSPDYPWARDTASEAVWALGTGMQGVSQACEEWRVKAEVAEAERDKLREALKEISVSATLITSVCSSVHEMRRVAESIGGFSNSALGKESEAGK